MLLPRALFPRKRDRLRRRAGAFLVDNAFRGLSRAGRAVPLSRPGLHDIEVLRDIPYRDSQDRAHHLDIYRPRRRTRRLPALLYVHGGGFRILSKETHWLMALMFARRGFVVFTPNYRLAPRHPFPAAHEDAAAAYVFVTERAALFGADPQRLVVAGESAGGNLALSLGLMASHAAEEPYARAVFDTGVVPKAVLPYCGILQVSAPERLYHVAKTEFVRDRIREVGASYLLTSPLRDDVSARWADPLCIAETLSATDRPLPPFFITCGTNDPLLDDSRRLKRALDRLGTPAELVEYAGGMHAFFAMLWQHRARVCWRDTFAYLDRLGFRSPHAPEAEGTAPRQSAGVLRASDAQAMARRERAAHPRAQGRRVPLSLS